MSVDLQTGFCGARRFPEQEKLLLGSQQSPLPKSGTQQMSKTSFLFKSHMGEQKNYTIKQYYGEALV